MSTLKTLKRVGILDKDLNGVTSSLIDAVNNYRALHSVTADRTVTAGTLGALNATVSISLEGSGSCGTQINAGTLAATLIAEQSIDGGSSWVTASFFNPVTQLVSPSLSLTNPNALTPLGIISMQGASHVRIKVSSYTSGSTTAILRAVFASGFQTTVSADRSDTDNNGSFSFSSVNLNLATAGTDNPVILLRNPSSSTVSVYIKGVTCGVVTTNVSALFNVYSTPTVTSNGTAQTPTNRTIGASTAANLLVNTLPTVSSPGTVISSFNIAQNSNSASSVDPYQLKLPPNTAILITGNPSSNNRQSAITVVWSEV